jgi:outer membrane protein OmpA-like peptidoglycan-associated protein
MNEAEKIKIEENAPTEVQNEKSQWNAITVLSVIMALVIGFLVAMTFSARSKTNETDIYTARAELAAKTSAINEERARQGLPPIEGVGADSPEQIAARLTRDATTLANYSDRFRTLLTEKDAIISQKNDQLLNSEEARKGISSQLVRVQGQFDKVSVDSLSTDSLRQQLNDANKNIQLLQSKLATMNSRPSSDEIAKANARIAELEALLAKAQLPAAAPVKLFAESEKDLYPAGQELFRALRELDDKSDMEIAAAYNRFASQLNATQLKDIRFATGSSQMNPADQLSLADGVSNVPEGALLLVVGYASTTGNSDANRQLSSDRATQVATNLDQAKPTNQIVQAVFLGQTNRFSSRIPERNQVCEVWQITSKK